MERSNTLVLFDILMQDNVLNQSDYTSGDRIITLDTLKQCYLLGSTVHQKTTIAGYLW